MHEKLSTSKRILIRARNFSTTNAPEAARFIVGNAASGCAKLCASGVGSGNRKSGIDKGALLQAVLNTGSPDPKRPKLCGNDAKLVHARLSMMARVFEHAKLGTSKKTTGWLDFLSMGVVFKCKEFSIRSTNLDCTGPSVGTTNSTCTDARTTDNES